MVPDYDVVETVTRVRSLWYFVSGCGLNAQHISVKRNNNNKNENVY